jgi:hypothetical protein
MYRPRVIRKFCLDMARVIGVGIQLVIDECNMGGKMLCDLVSTLAPAFEGHARSISLPGSFVDLVPAVEDIADVEPFELIPKIASMGHLTYIYTLAHQLGWIESTT